MNTAPCLRKRKKAPSDDEWSRIKREFERLYTCSDMTLGKISAILARDHQFVAAPHMYKHRITQWGLKKYFKKEELEAVAATLGHFVQIGLEAPTAMIGNRKVPIQRAERHFRSLLRPRDLQNLSETSIAQGQPPCRQHYPDQRARRKTEARRLQRQPQVIPRVLLQQSEESHLLESTLVLVNNYYVWRLTQDENYFNVQTRHGGEHAVAPDLLYPISVVVDITDNIFTAQNGGSQIAPLLLRTGLDQAHILLHQQHPSLIQSLIYFAATSFQRESRYDSTFLSYLFACSRKSLGPGHPVSMVLRLLQWQETSTKIANLSVLKVMCEIAKRQRGISSDTVFELEYHIVSACIMNDEFDIASQHCQKLLRHYGDTFGERHIFYRRLLLQLGYLHYRHDDNDKAEEILLRVLELDDFCAEDVQSADGVSMGAMEVLTGIYEKKKDVAAEEKWLSLAYEAACNWFGLDDSSTQRYLSLLKRVRSKMGVPLELSDEQLTDDSDFFEELESRIAQMDLGDSPVGQDFEARAAPWNEWEGHHHEGDGRIGTITEEKGEDALGRVDRLAVQVEHETTSRPAVHPDTGGQQHALAENVSQDYQPPQTPPARLSEQMPAEKETYQRLGTGSPGDYSSMPEERVFLDAQNPRHDLFDETLFDFAQLDRMANSDDHFNPWPLGMDMQDENWTIEPTPNQPEAGLPVLDTHPADELQPWLAATEQQDGSIPVTGTFDFEDFGTIEMLEGMFDFQQWIST